jgi:hypothetical protein
VHHDTASITAWHPSVRFPGGVRWHTHEAHPTIYDWERTATEGRIVDNMTHPFPSAHALRAHPLQEELCTALQAHWLPFVRFDVCDRPLHSHLDMMARIPWLHDYGRGIVRHYVGNGLLVLDEPPSDAVR